jgi:hypothetical protein
MEEVSTDYKDNSEKMLVIYQKQRPRMDRCGTFKE